MLWQYIVIDFEHEFHIPDVASNNIQVADEKIVFLSILQLESLYQNIFKIMI